MRLSHDYGNQAGIYTFTDHIVEGNVHTVIPRPSTLYLIRCSVPSTASDGQCSPGMLLHRYREILERLKRDAFSLPFVVIFLPAGTQQGVYYAQREYARNMNAVKVGKISQYN